jgi:hypothetical protein
MLDRAPEARVETLKGGVLDFLDAVEASTNMSNFATLTKMELVDQLIAKVSPQYTHWVTASIEIALAAVPPGTAIGEYNRRRILAFVTGSRAAVESYNVEDREAERGQVESVPEGAVPVWPETGHLYPEYGDPRFPGSVA